MRLCKDGNEVAGKLRRKELVGDVEIHVRPDIALYTAWWAIRN